MRYPTLFSGHSTKSRWLSGRKALIFLQHGNSWGELLAYLSTCALNDNLLSISKPDSKLWFNAHVDKICEKLASRIAVLRKIRAFLPLSEVQIISPLPNENSLLTGSLFGERVKKRFVYPFPKQRACSLDKIIQPPSPPPEKNNNAKKKKFSPVQIFQLVI